MDPSSDSVVLSVLRTILVHSIAKKFQSPAFQPAVRLVVYRCVAKPHVLIIVVTKKIDAFTFTASVVVLNKNEVLKDLSEQVKIGDR